MRPLPLAIVCLTFALSVHAAGVEKLTVRSKGADRTYYLFIPDGLPKDTPVPLLLTLHGSGRNGRSLVDPWRTLAEKEHFIVAGPDSINSAVWAAPIDGPALLRDVVEEVKKRAAVDSRRIYLFGHSAGATFGLQLAMIQSEYFAAVAIHAGALVPQDYSLLDFPTRKVPVALFVGTEDPGYPLAQVRATRDAFQQKGFPVQLTEIPRHDHNYYAIAQKINESVWSFLRQHALAGEAKFVEYANM
jgi:poly(3-hydroxybutyrate) depolymerase